MATLGSTLLLASFVICAYAASISVAMSATRWRSACLAASGSPKAERSRR